jgi:hypothetical protein
MWIRGNQEGAKQMMRDAFDSSLRTKMNKYGGTSTDEYYTKLMTEEQYLGFIGATQRDDFKKMLKVQQDALAETSVAARRGAGLAFAAAGFDKNIADRFITGFNEVGSVDGAGLHLTATEATDKLLKEVGNDPDKLIVLAERMSHDTTPQGLYMYGVIATKAQALANIRRTGKKKVSAVSNITGLLGDLGFSDGAKKFLNTGTGVWSTKEEAELKHALGLRAPDLGGAELDALTHRVIRAGRLGGDAMGDIVNELVSKGVTTQRAPTAGKGGDPMTNFALEVGKLVQGLEDFRTGLAGILPYYGVSESKVN